MRIEDIVDDEYWMAQLSDYFNRQGMVKVPIGIDRSTSSAEEAELVDLSTTPSRAQTYRCSARCVDELENELNGRSAPRVRPPV